MTAESRPSAQTVSEGQIIQPENLANKEQYRLTKAVAVVFYHAPGVGGSTLAKNFAEMLGVDTKGDRYYDGGKDLRDKTGNTSAQTEYMTRPKSADKDIDQTQMNLFSIATNASPVIINAKLGGRNAWKFMQEHPDIILIPVLVTCDARVAAARMRDRKIDELDARFNEIRNDQTAGIITADQYDDFLDILQTEAYENTTKRIRQETRERIDKDIARFTSIYPELRGIKSLYRPEPTVITGISINPDTGEKTPIREKLFKYQLSTTHKKPEESLRALIELLLKSDEIEEVKKPTSKLPEIVFDSELPREELSEPISARTIGN